MAKKIQVKQILELREYSCWPVPVVRCGEYRMSGRAIPLRIIRLAFYPNHKPLSWINLSLDRRFQY